MLLMATFALLLSQGATGPLKPFKFERLQFRSEVAGLLTRRDYAKLELLATGLRQDDPHFSSGTPKLSDFYRALAGEPGDVGNPLFAEGEARLLEWVQRSPRAHVPKICLADRALWRATAARGSEWADTVSPSQWAGFTRHLAVATSWAEKALADNPNDPEAFTQLISLCIYQGCSRDAANNLLARSISLNSKYETAYVEMAKYLLPRWHGSSDILTDFAGTASDANRHLGDMIYARVATVAMLLDAGARRPPFARLYPRLEWRRIRAGLFDLDRRFPDSMRTYHLLARFARVYADRDTARMAFTRLGPQWTPEGEDTWFRESAFREAWSWAFQDAP